MPENVIRNGFFHFVALKNMNKVLVAILFLIVLVNSTYFSEGVWLTFEEFFLNYQRLDEAHIIDIPDKRCPPNMRRIASGDCRKTY